MEEKKVSTEKKLSNQEIIWKCPKGCNTSAYSNRRCKICGSWILCQCIHCNKWISYVNKSHHEKKCLEQGIKKRKLEEIHNQKVIINFIIFFLLLICIYRKERK